MVGIAHYHGFGRNYGDLAIQYSMVERLQIESIQKHARVMEYFPMDLKNGECLDPYVDFLNDNFKVFVVGAGGMIMKGDNIDTVSGWQFNMSIDALKKLKIPVFFYGLGYNVFPNEPELDDATIDHIRECNNHSLGFSVRDTQTLKWCEDHDIDAELTADPAFFTSKSDLKLPNLPDNAILIGLNWAGDREQERMGAKYGTMVGTLIDELNSVLLEEKNAKIIYIPHVESYDDVPGSMFANAFGDRFYDLKKNLPWMYPECISYVPHFVGIYSSLAAMVGMRWHSSVLAFSQMIPSIGIGGHAKNKYFSEDYGTPLSVDCKGVGKFVSKAMYETVNMEQFKVLGACDSRLKQFEVNIVASAYGII